MTDGPRGLLNEVDKINARRPSPHFTSVAQ
jgi:hypothetical protein